MFKLGCEEQKTSTANYVQDVTKIPRNVQCLILGLMDLTLNKWQETGCLKCKCLLCLQGIIKNS